MSKGYSNFPPGAIINDTYRVERLLGEGGMAYVYTVSHMRLPRRFALKLIRATLDDDPSLAARFRQEAEILASLRHSHLVDVVDWNVTAEGQPYLVMELLDGEDLASFLSRSGPLPQERALSICRQVGEALRDVHSAGIVHRDLKPGNIFLCRSGPIQNFVKVLDFGIAKLTQGQRAFVTIADMIGTPAYMAPEQALGRSVDARADQFALAAILYEMLTGRAAFASPEEPAMVVLSHVLHDEPPALLPPGPIARAIYQALRKDPTQRFPSMGEFLQAVGCAAPLNASAPASTTTLSPRGETVSPPGAPRVVDRALRMAAGATLALGVLLAVSYFSTRAPAPAPEIVRQTKAAQHEAAQVVAAQHEPPPVVAAQHEPPPVVAAQHEPPPAEAPPSQPTGAPPAEPKVATRATPTRVTPPLRTHGQHRFAGKVDIKGATPALATQIRGCIDRHLRGKVYLSSRKPIRLARTGSLQLVEAPDSVRNSDFPICLRESLTVAPLPERVEIYVRE